MRSLVGTHVHSAYNVTASPSGAADVVKPAKATVAAVVFSAPIIAASDANTSRGGTRSSGLASGGRVADVGRRSATQDNVDAMAGVTPPMPVSEKTAGNTGNSPGTTTNGSGIWDKFQSARHAGSVTVGFPVGCPAVDAVWPAASMHAAVSVPVQPDAPLTISVVSSKSVEAASSVPLAPTTKVVSVADTIIPTGREASSGFSMPHDVTLTAREQVAASRDTIRSVSDSTKVSPGSVASVGVDSHTTVNVAGYFTRNVSFDMAPAAFTTTTDTIGKPGADGSNVGVLH